MVLSELPDEFAWGGAMVRRSREVELALINERKRAVLLDSIVRVVRTAFYVGGVAFCASEASESVQALAGRQTEFSSLVNWAVKMDINKWLGYAFATLSSCGWFAERRLRRRSIAKKSEYEKELERRIDPKRSSSNLNNDGSPRKEDRDAS